ncbi:MAG: 1,2-phenylacetyl-CoA epoxidase subunit PaaD [Bacteroidota bacterium]|jgi:ring-1,2-phenylacetyl-CoA epoxidase subunit PaaD
MVKDAEIIEYLQEVFDPEIPVLTILDLGIVRGIKIEKDHVQVTITPTYTGCPAMKTIEEQIKEKLAEKGVVNVDVDLVISPAWTTDWISEDGRNKLREYGIAPPEDEVDKSVLFAKHPTVPCPRCSSSNTRMISLFGSTACKAQYQCNECLEPFDYFKCLR